jgi:predicted N-formylglutamate amidohydrolase
LSGEASAVRFTNTNVRDFIVVTCEHGGNRIPPEYTGLFRGWQSILRSHRGYDAGALVMARDLAAGLRAPLAASTVSRLLVDLNRSPSNPRVWSEVTRSLTVADKERVMQGHYAPYHAMVATIVDKAVTSGHRVIHISSHTFTPVLGGHTRTADVGLLYDPARPGEVVLAAIWKTMFAEQHPRLRVRRNYPYAGKGDGLTRSLRRSFTAKRYVGIELELNQALVLGGAKTWQALRRGVVATLQAALRRYPGARSAT